MRGGTLSPGDGYASPLITNTAFHSLAIETGVEFMFGERVIGLDMEGTKIRRLRTDKDVYEAELFVDAAGAQAAEVAALTGPKFRCIPTATRAA